MGKINLLSFEVANLIAAGEVVERPASAVKELLENSIDAHADKITLEIQRGGVSFIRVADNGEGIEKEDLIPCITRHSTSKIRSAQDLTSISTLGFRGEAMAAIASVSRLRILSKTPGTVLGSMLETEGGKNVTVSDTGCAEGTTIIVEDLFFNVPARRKFLKKDTTEAIAVSGVIEKIALSHPEISFKFISDGEMKFMTSGNGSLRDTIYSLFGRDTAKRALEVNREENGIAVTGFISEPDIIKANRNSEYFFINGRAIKSRTASAAIEQAYSSKIPHDKFPFCVLNIGINPAAVDVNVHPTKLEVKFANEKSVFEAVYYAVLSALDAEAMRPELNIGNDRTNPFTGGLSSNELMGAFRPLDERNRKPEQFSITDTHGSRDTDIPKSSTCPDEVRENYKKTHSNISFTAQPSDPNQAEEEQKARRAIIDRLNEKLEKDESGSEPVQMSYSPVKNDPYSIYDEPLRESDIPEYFIIGEAWNCYVIVEVCDRLIIFDKHAAHERIIFDELCRKMRASLRSSSPRSGQILLSPIEVTVTPAEAEALEEYREKIISLGFDYQTEKRNVSSYTVLISQIPNDLDNEASVELFSTLLTKLSDSTSTVEAAAEGFFETRLWQASCKAAIKGGRQYDIAHIKWICDRLFTKPDKNNQVIRTCPHGRPVAFEIKKTSIDRQFDRLK